MAEGVANVHVLAGGPLDFGDAAKPATARMGLVRYLFGRTLPDNARGQPSASKPDGIAPNLRLPPGGQVRGLLDKRDGFCGADVWVGALNRHPGFSTLDVLRGQRGLRPRFRVASPSLERLRGPLLLQRTAAATA